MHCVITGVALQLKFLTVKYVVFDKNIKIMHELVFRMTSK